MFIKTNIEYLMAERGLNPYSLANAAPGVNQPTLFRILSGESKDPRTSTLQPIADFFWVSVEDLRHKDLRTGIGYRKQDRSGQASVAEDGKKIASYLKNTELGPAAKGMVPVISWVAAGSWSEATDLLHPGDAESWAPCIASHGARTYALRVRGDSMTSAHGKSYPDGCLIFVDPDQRDPANGQGVIAKVNGDNAVTFKVIAMDAGRVWLRALNPAYPPITDHFRVLGTVIGKWEDA